MANDNSMVGERLAAEEFGVTAGEQRSGEPLEERLARELPDAVLRSADGAELVPSAPLGLRAHHARPAGLVAGGWGLTTGRPG